MLSETEGARPREVAFAVGPHRYHRSMEPITEALERDTDEGTAADQTLVEDELLVEEISIDGMCGVY